ncbi:MAG: hypothetical protein JWQ81_8585 [Amycolatopsis sp.]|jgi:DNA-binding transcriptional MerR regulator|uniref:hypothetical protein n=1 Tax=Amycolatopsis sp. TaxID=37632 RepID=UPI0026329B3A|nr:hypothetical protein [Amycolatopsis sp.]MCU1687846.1 hypothetical protein [Amycolatopsis sp.]
MPDNTSPQQKELTAERKVKIVAWRRDGVTFEEIGRLLNPDAPLTKQTVWEHYKRALKETPAMEVQQYRTEQLERLDGLLRSAREVLDKEHIAVSNGKVMRNPDSGEVLLDDGPKLQAIETIRKLEERRAKLLGLDSPVKVEQTGSTTVNYLINGVDVGKMT